jgi:hypothetical protein
MQKYFSFQNNISIAKIIFQKLEAPSGSKTGTSGRPL